MSSSRQSLSEPRSGIRGSGPEASAQSLAARLQSHVEDRRSSGAELVLAASATLERWCREQAEDWSWASAGRELELGLRAFIDRHGWRGTCAVWVDSLRRAWQRGKDLARADVRARELLAHELALWLASEASADPDDDRQEVRKVADRRRDGLEGSARADRCGEWLECGPRLPSREELARHAVAGVEKSEVILVSSFSKTVALALQAAQAAGKEPHAIVCECRPSLDGRRMALELARSAIPVTLCYDAALVAHLPSADRVWLATEAIGSDALIARIGTRALVQEAERLEVPVCVLATSDKLIPGGELALPRDAGSDPALAWHDAPASVREEQRAFESVSLDEVPRFVTEIGAETATALHLRALRIDAAPPCASEATLLNSITNGDR
jgi:hypothetical protein